MTQPPASASDTGDPVSVEIRELTLDELNAAAAILTRGMLNNPLHLRVFGADPARRGRRLSHFLGALVGYVHRNGVVMGAFVQGNMVGVLGMIRPGRCRPILRDRLRIGLALMVGTPPAPLWRVHRWLAGWARHDPDERHWHIGPLSVLPKHRRRGIGRRLMQACCHRLDSLDRQNHGDTVAWLETDLQINAEFYHTLGFDLVRLVPVLGVPTWFMRRAPCSAPR